MLTFFQFSSVAQYRVQLLATPQTAARQASLSITNSRSLHKLISIESVMPSNHLILCHPLLFLSSIFPSMRVFSNESVLCIRWPEYLSFSFSISSSDKYWGVISLKFFTFFKKHYFWFKWRTHSVCIQIHTDTHTHTHTRICICMDTHNRAKYCIAFIYLFCWPHHMACGILVSQSGMEPTPPALKAES